MNIRVFILILTLHFGVSAVGFFGLSTWAMAVQDSAAQVEAAAATGSSTPMDGPSGTAPVIANWLDRGVHFVLLQPLAHWLLASGRIAWWTWPGLVAWLGLIALNSLIVAGAAASGLASLRARRSRA